MPLNAQEGRNNLLNFQEINRRKNEETVADHLSLAYNSRILVSLILISAALGSCCISVAAIYLLANPPH